MGDVDVIAVHAAHTRRRWVLTPPTEPLGFIIQGSSTVYFAGDTALFDGMEDLHERIDVALLPIETWGVRPPEGRHLSPRTAAGALALLRPRIAVPIHWGTLYLPGSAYAGKAGHLRLVPEDPQAAGGVRRPRRRDGARRRGPPARPGRVADRRARRERPDAED